MTGVNYHNDSLIFELGLKIHLTDESIIPLFVAAHCSAAVLQNSFIHLKIPQPEQQSPQVTYYRFLQCRPRRYMSRAHRATLPVAH